MKQNILRAFAPSLFLVALLTGCMNAKFVAWQGEQRNWPVEAGNLAETVGGMTVFHGPPPKPYDVIGMLALDGSDWADPIAKAVKECRRHGGDAIVVLEHGKYQRGTISKSHGTFTGTTTFSGMGANTRGNYNSTTFGFPQYNETATCIVIRFK